MTLTLGRGLPIIVILRRESFVYQRAFVMVGVVLVGDEAKIALLNKNRKRAIKIGNLIDIV